MVGIAGGSSHLLALKSDGTVAAWGIDNYAGEITVPTGLTGVTSIAASSNSNIALKNDGTVVAWGYATLPPSSGTLNNAVAIAAGSSSGSGSGIALRSDGTVTGWGSGLASVPAGLSGVVGIAARNTSALAARNDGTVVAWGGSSPLPATLSGVVAVAVADNFGAALKNDGTVTTWGQLPVNIDPSYNNNIIAIATGSSHLLTLKSDGTVLVWGWLNNNNNDGNKFAVPAGLNGVVSIGAGDSFSIALQAVASPVFSAQPLSCTVNPGQTVTLVAAANATTYQWYQGSSGDTSQPVAGATTPWLVLPMPVQVGTYWVRATNALGTGDSHSASVALYPPPPNDDFANAITLTGSSLQTTGTNAGAGRQTGEPAIPPNTPSTTGRSVWWNWTAPTDGVVTVDTIGSSFDTVLAVYTGSTLDTLTTVQTNENGGANRTSLLSFQASTGTTYQIAVDGVNGLTGNIALNLTLSNTFAPSLIMQPANIALTAGGNASLSASFLAYPPPTYQWQRLPAGSGTWANLSEGAPYSGTATATLTVGSVNVGQSGDQFRCVVTNGLPPDATSNPATLTVTPPAFATWAASLGLSGASAAAEAVPFTDGAPNLVRYAMNLGATPMPGQLPVLTSVPENGVLYLKLQYRQRKGLTGVTLTPEWAPDLQTWSAVAPADLAQLPDDDADTARFEARAAVPPSGRVFLRLRATLTP